MTPMNPGGTEIARAADSPPYGEGTFLRQLDHDLRTPLGTMAAALDLLRTEPPGSPMHSDAIAVMQRQLARLHWLTESLREYSQTIDG